MPAETFRHVLVTTVQDAAHYTSEVTSRNVGIVKPAFCYVVTDIFNSKFNGLLDVRLRQTKTSQSNFQSELGFTNSVARKLINTLITLNPI